LVAALAGLECAIRHEQSVHRPTKMPEFLPSLDESNGSAVMCRRLAFRFRNPLKLLTSSTVHGVVFALLL
ncbi:hypothetical protein, partial [Bradyrhizobium sp. 147]|uniref:hypothetical protein n=1 Tax=Bradyrhizobium sp. 147 TaxID=2782623 RepID=UPI001FFA7134